MQSAGQHLRAIAVKRKRGHSEWPTHFARWSDFRNALGSLARDFNLIDPVVLDQRDCRQTGALALSKTPQARGTATCSGCL